MSDANLPARGDPKPVAIIEQIRGDLHKMAGQFEAVLPAHIPVDRFIRVVMTAVQNNRDLLACRRQSLLNACIKAATDGLIPDGREGAIVPFGESEDGGAKSEQAQWMPMIGGIRKKARNSGELSDWYAHVVYAGDEFDYELGDNPHIRHKPALNGGRTRPITHAYSIAKLKDGTISREVMNIAEIEEIRKRYSRARRGPWSDPVAYPEMVRKTVLRNHSKSLPMSTDLDTVIRRDDVFYDMSGPAPEEPRGRGRPRTRLNTRAALDHFSGGGDPTNPPTNPEHATDGEIIENDPPPKETKREAKAKEPKNFEEYREMVMVKCANTTDAGVLRAWWVSDDQRKLRNTAGLVAEETGELRDMVEKRIADLGA